MLDGLQPAVAELLSLGHFQRRMKCSTHCNVDATAICIHCGRALCLACSTKSESGRTVCSRECASHLLQAEEVLSGLRKKAITSGKLTAYFCFGIALVFAGFGITELRRGTARTVGLLFPAAVALIITGLAFLISTKGKRDR